MFAMNDAFLAAKRDDVVALKKLAQGFYLPERPGENPVSASEDSGGWTVLHSAAHAGSERAVQYLLKLGSDPDR